MLIELSAHTTITEQWNTIPQHIPVCIPNLTVVPNQRSQINSLLSQNCELNTFKASQLSPSSTSLIHMLSIFPYFSLIVPRSYCMLILSFSQSSKSDNALVLIELLTLKVLYRSGRPGTIACGLYSDESQSIITTNQSLFASVYCGVCAVAVH